MGKSMEKKRWMGNIALFLAALIWGLSFVAQSVGMEKIDGFTFSALRQLLGGVLVASFVFVRRIIEKKEASKRGETLPPLLTKKTWLYGILLGVVFCIATNLQQFAFLTSSGGKIAFVTAMYMFFVPLIGVFLGKKSSLLVWTSVFIALVGLYFLCVSENGIGGITQGDILTFFCAIAYAVQIIMLDKYVQETDGVVISAIQFLFSSACSFILMFIFEEPQMTNIISALPEVLYAGFLSCGVAFTLQAVGQKHTEATVASLILCLESVIGAISEVLILHKIMSTKEMIGCVIIFVAILISQLADSITAFLKSKLFRGKI